MRYLGTRTLPSLTVMVVLVACGSASTSPLLSPAVATPNAVAPGPTSSPTTLSPLPPSTATPTPATASTEGSTPAAITIGGTWVRPRADATLTSYAMTLSARPTASGPGVTTFTKVVFSATWAGANKKVVCTATKPGSGGSWACKANLLARGVPPGKVSFSFSVQGEGVPTAYSPGGSRKITYAVPPPRPTASDLTQIKPPDFEHGDNTGTYRVSWSAPAGYADEFLVYYTEECPRPSTRKNAGAPCFIAGTPVQVSKLELLGTAPGDARSILARIAESDCEGIHGSILLRARSSYGKSTFAIVQAARVFWRDPDSNDTIC